MSCDCHPFFRILNAVAARVCKSNYVEMNYDPAPFVESECFPCGGDAKSHRKCQEKRLRRQKPSKVEQSLHSRSLHLGSLAFNTQQWSKRYLLKIYHSRCYWLVKKYMININYNRPICQILWIFIKSLSFYATFNQKFFFFIKYPISRSRVTVPPFLLAVTTRTDCDEANSRLLLILWQAPFSQFVSGFFCSLRFIFILHIHTLRIRRVERMIYATNYQPVICRASYCYCCKIRNLISQKKKITERT